MSSDWGSHLVTNTFFIAEHYILNYIFLHTLSYNFFLHKMSIFLLKPSYGSYFILDVLLSVQLLKR